MKTILLFLFLTISFLTYSQSKDSIAINQVLKEQLIQWNQGSIEGFMKGYWNNEQLRFITKKGVNYGWQNVLNSYKKSFPTKDAMGKLDFKVDRISSMDKNLCLVTGQWLVESTNENKSGYFSLIFKKFKNEWLIIVDNTF
ncbi:MAG: nuclear transport factor 2 family protein [Bacteroidetes bacterium]|nr:nuclear transport factor 2 family protein [Bacteroidota bacterium]